MIPTNKAADIGIFPIFECSEGELEYEQDVPGKMIEPSEQGEIIPDVAWEIRIKCNKETKIAYGPWADRQRLIISLNFLINFNGLFFLLIIENIYGNIFFQLYMKILQSHLNQRLVIQEYLNPCVLIYHSIVQQH